MAEVEIEEFIEQNKHLATLVDTYRGISESEKQWKARREFLFRNINDFEDPHIDQLLALSMVWANNVFLGCRYSPDLLEKMKEMAEGIVVEDAPVFKTRDEIMKKQIIWQYVQAASQPQTTCNHASPGPPYPASSPAGLSETSHPDT
ncbi:CDKN2AIP N-terminal-like protein isoform X1 [Oncorhynchus keta]|uniref:CDKN2AIP N-terminal-like protein isoform X1 n=1 Tax=Oncorhynchus keta TaxID=8018 RepID=UPI0015FDCC85|nr:CDKN2AIP N-terminal-like protein isoform X1 [Oncorhynchus keta]